MFKPGTIIAATGLLGMGKTMQIVKLGYEEWRAGRRVVANFDTCFAERLENIPQLITVSNCVVLLDEAQTIIDSREFKTNILLTHWVEIIRKDDCTLFYTTQSFGRVDLRLRELTGFLYFAEQHISLPAGTASQICRYAVSPTGMAQQLDRFPLLHSWYGPLYRTKDKRVVLGKTWEDLAYSPVDKMLEETLKPSIPKGGHSGRTESRRNEALSVPATRNGHL